MVDVRGDVALFDVRDSGSPTKPLSVLIKLSICIDIWPRYVADIVACWRKSLFSGNERVNIDMQK